jgi:hypothetical protein
MYHIETDQLDLMVTPEHRMWVSSDGSSFDFEMMKDIADKERYYLMHAEWSVEDYQFPQALEWGIDMNTWLKFLGNWISHGYTAYEILFNLSDMSDNDYEIIDKIEKYCETIDGKLPEWIWSLSSRQSQIVLDNIMTDFEKDGIPYGNINSKNDIMKLALHCGLSTYQYTNQYGKRLNINHKKYTPVVNADYIRSIKNYNKPVFCLEVPSEVFYVRRNGKACWTGNSRARGPRTLLTRQAPEGRSREGGLRLGKPILPKSGNANYC